MTHKIIVLIPFRNAGKYISACIDSVIKQQYTNYEIYLLDDCSTDKKLFIAEDKFYNTYSLRNKKKLGALGNLYTNLLGLSFNEDDIIIILDGDDYLIGEYVFQIINQKYNSGILLTYGQYIDNFGGLGHCSAYTKSEFQQIRKAPWKASHLKTFKYKLFKEYIAQDPNGKYLKNPDDSFLMSTYDIALMTPLMEIAGYHNTSFIHNIIYCYRLHANNDHATQSGKILQKETEFYIRHHFTPLKQLF